MQQFEELTDIDLSAFRSEDAKYYLRMVQKKSKKEPAISGNQALKSIFENANLDDGFKDIIQNLLTLNPYFRWTASECLAHPFFDDVRLENT